MSGCSRLPSQTTTSTTIKKEPFGYVNFSAGLVVCDDLEPQHFWSSKAIYIIWSMSKPINPSHHKIIILLLLNPFTFNVLIDFYNHKINSKRSWLCYWFLTLSIFSVMYIIIQKTLSVCMVLLLIPYSLKFLIYVYDHKIDYELSLFCYWFFTRSMY